MATSEVNKLFTTVVNGGYCIGCGSCASVKNSPVQIKLNDYGMYEATLDTSINKSEINSSIAKVCPFSESSLNEDQISKQLFGKDCKYDHKIGYYLDTFAGYVQEGDFRQSGSSGGIGTWILYSLLEKRLVDSVIHIQANKPTEDDTRLFKYSISTTIEEVTSGAKTRYYPVEMSEVLKIIQDRPGSYAIVGIPCFIKAIRLLMNQDSVLNERIKFCIGLICGHLKSNQFAKMFAWQSGISPETIQSIDFRKKLPQTVASAYGVEVTGLENGEKLTKVSDPVNKMYGTNWGLGFFKYKACDYCDDITAETADLTVGDAWFPQYVTDNQGTNVVVVRNPVLAQILQEGIKTGKVKLDKIKVKDLVRSQDANYRHRRTGLAYRLYLAEKNGEWHPPKRVKASNIMLPWLKKRFLLRMLLAEKSHVFFKEALESGRFSVFVEKMDSLIQSYNETYNPPAWVKFLKKLRTFFKKNRTL
jgi:coenzyme F420-reducing hydrogenase beta subunit